MRRPPVVRQSERQTATKGDNDMATIYEWNTGSQGGDFSEAVAGGGPDLLYTYKSDGKFGVGVRFRCTGLVFLSKPLVSSRASAQNYVEQVYEDLVGPDSAEILAQTVPQIPTSVAGSEGTPKYPA